MIRHPPGGRRIRHSIESAGLVIYMLFFALIGAFPGQSAPHKGTDGDRLRRVTQSEQVHGRLYRWPAGRSRTGRERQPGFGLLSQAGVAIGLALVSANRFLNLEKKVKHWESLIINVITATTFLEQIIGPNFVNFANGRVGEIGQAKLGDDAWASKGTPE